MVASQPQLNSREDNISKERQGEGRHWKENRKGKKGKQRGRSRERVLEEGTRGIWQTAFAPLVSSGDNPANKAVSPFVSFHWTSVNPSFCAVLRWSYCWRKTPTNYRLLNWLVGKESMNMENSTSRTGYASWKFLRESLLLCLFAGKIGYLILWNETNACFWCIARNHSYIPLFIGVKETSWLC